MSIQCCLSCREPDCERLAANEAELAASESLVTALQEQMARLAEQHAKAVAEAREEQREACATFIKNERYETWAEIIRATPLDSTPLAARIAELEAELSEIRTLAGADASQDAYEAVDWLLQAKNHAEADALGQSHAKDRAESALAAEVERHQATAKALEQMTFERDSESRWAKQYHAACVLALPALETTKEAHHGDKEDVEHFQRNCFYEQERGKPPCLCPTCHVFRALDALDAALASLPAGPREDR